MDKKEQIELGKNISIFSSKIKNLIPSEWVLLPIKLIDAFNRVEALRTKAVRLPYVYDIKLLNKYEDKMIGSAMGTNGADFFLIQFNKFEYAQLYLSTNPLSNECYGVGGMIYTSGGDMYENFLKENENLEQHINEQKFGFGGV